MSADRRDARMADSAPPASRPPLHDEGASPVEAGERPVADEPDAPSDRTGRLVLVTGGARSGKSAFAERLAAGARRPVVYVATASVSDDEMLRRVERHRADRPAAWRTVEAPTRVADALAGLHLTGGVQASAVTSAAPAVGDATVAETPPAFPDARVTATVPAGPVATVLLEDLGNLVANLLFGVTGGGEPGPDAAERLEAAVADELDALAAAWRAGGWDLLVVTNEVGLGIVPATPVGRVFRDALGRANQRLAALADAAYLLVAGQALRIKPACPACSPDLSPPDRRRPTDDSPCPS